MVKLQKKSLLLYVVVNALQALISLTFVHAFIIRIDFLTACTCRGKQGAFTKSKILQMVTIIILYDNSNLKKRMILLKHDTKYSRNIFRCIKLRYLKIF